MCDMTYSREEERWKALAFKALYFHLWDMTHSYVRHDSFIFVTCLIHLRKHGGRSCFWSTQFLSLCVCMRVIHILVYTRKSLSLGALFPTVRFDSFVCVTWLIHNCDITYSCEEERRKALAFRRSISICVSVCDTCSFICVTWFVHMCDMNYSYLRYGSFMSETQLIHMCDMTYSYVWHDLYIWWRAVEDPCL